VSILHFDGWPVTDAHAGRTNMKTDPLLAAVIAHIPVISNMALREDTIRLAAGNAKSFLGSQAPRRALLPATAVDLLVSEMHRYVSYLTPQFT
jgi:hypothetical protein